MRCQIRLLVIVLLIILPVGKDVRAQPSDEAILSDSLTLVLGETPAARFTLDALVATGDERLAHTLIMAMRYAPLPRHQVSAAIAQLTGEPDRERWFDWMLWRQAREDLPTHPTFAAFQRGIFQRIDPRFLEFLPPDVPHEIRLEEIAWGGVRVDGIPALTNPDFLTPDAADYINDDDLVFGVEINGDARAYPLRILDWHEMFNDVIGGVPVSLAYCTLCGAGILFDTTVEGHDEPFVFGSSGFLYRSNKLMYDTQTNSLWNQFTGQPVVGPLVGSGIELAIRPVAITAWADWLAENPETRVLSIDTGHRRDYGPGVAYNAYFSSPDLMFPALVENESLAAKDYVFGIRATGGAKAWPLTAFEGGAVINDSVGLVDVVLIGDAATRTVRAYDRGDLTFGPFGAEQGLIADGQSWEITEAALVGPDGRTLPRVAGHVAYWFAWQGNLGDAALYDAAN